MTKQLSQKADIALADLTAGTGLLTPEQNETFIRRLEDSTTILSAIRTYPMNGPTARINSIGFGDFITFPSNWDPTLNNANHDGRKFRAPYRSKPITQKIELTTKPVKAVVYLPYEVLEDNMERGNLQNTIVALIANKFAYNMEAMVTRGVAGGASAIPLLNYMDGMYALATDHVVDAANDPLSDALFAQALRTMPKKYRNDLNAIRYFTGQNATIDLREARSQRQTGLGDSTLTDNAPLRTLGVQVLGHGNNPETQMLLTPPQNVIFGIQRNVRIETDRDIEEEQVKIVVTARVAVQMENKDAAVKVINIGGLTSGEIGS